MPFFIEWDAPPDLHPGAAIAEHDVGPRGISWIELTAEEELLHEWLGDRGLPLRLMEGPPSVSAVAISTAEGELVLR